MPIHKESHHKRHEEEYTIHDPKREACLQHTTCLIHIDAEGRVAYAQGRDVDGVACGGNATRAGEAAGDIGAVLRGNATELVDASDEGANEGKVDYGDKGSGAAGGVMAEESSDGPSTGEDGNDEEDAMWGMEG